MKIVSGNLTPRGTGAGLDHSVIPMINVVFLILMFFLVVGHLQGIDASGIEVPLSNVDEPVRGNEESIILAADGVITWRGQQMKVDALKSIADSSGISLPPKVVVLTDAATRSAAVLELIVTLKQTGVESVALVTVQKSERPAASFQE